MKIAIVYSPIRTSISFSEQAQLLCQGLTQQGVKCNIFPTFTDKLKEYDVLLWWQPFYTSEFEANALERYSKIQIFSNVSDTTMLSREVIEKLHKMPIDAIMVPSKWSARAYQKVGLPIIIIPHIINPVIEDIEPELKDDKVVIYGKNFPIRRGYDIASVLFEDGYDITNMEFQLKEHFLYELGRYNKLFYPLRGGAFELIIFEALALGMNVTVTKDTAPYEYLIHESDAYILNYDGEFKNTEYKTRKDKYHVGNYLNVNVTENDVFKFLDFKSTANPKLYIDKFSPEKVAFKFLEAIEDDLSQ